MMGAGNRYQREFGHLYVEDRGVIKEYVGIGWIPVNQIRPTVKPEAIPKAED